MKRTYLNEKLTFGQKASDTLTAFAGSWFFIISLVIFMILWIVINLKTKYKWDPYPFILLNFVLSTLAAIQAPIILMSQNRAAERDRLMAKHDYEIDKKSESEVEDMQLDLEVIKSKLNLIIEKLSSKKISEKK